MKALSSDGCCSLAILFSVQEHFSPSSLTLNRSTKILLKIEFHVKLVFTIMDWKIMSTSHINIPSLFSLNCFCDS